MIDKISTSTSELSGVSEVLFDYMQELKTEHGLRVTPCTDFSNNIREFTISDGFRIIQHHPQYTRPGIKRELVLVVNPDVVEVFFQGPFQQASPSDVHISRRKPVYDFTQIACQSPVLPDGQ